MASKNVVREDVVCIGFEVENDPLLDMLRQIKKMANVFDNETMEMIDDMHSLTKSANVAGNDIRDMGLQAEKLGNADVNNLVKDIKKVSKTAIRAENDLKDASHEGEDLGKVSLRQLLGDLRNVSEEGGDTKNALDEARDSAGKLGGVLGSIGVGVGAGAILGSVNDVQSALNQFQAQTGSLNEVMGKYGEYIKEIYAQNMGEDVMDVARSMAIVENNTGLANEMLRDTTYNALLIRDTFEFDVNESVRSAKMLMDQFGISGSDAYNLIAQGAQSGLDKNGDLLDTINEYSVHFKALGMNGEQMMNMLVNGVKNGTFSVDKLGDSIKEFGIRAIDGSQTSLEGFQILGLDAKRMMSAFALGGDTAKGAFDEVTTALSEITDPVKQNAAAVALFGTMAEDLGVDGVLAMKNLTGGISLTKDALKQINDVKYNDAGSALKSLGRTINIEISDGMNSAVAKAKISIEDFSSGIKGEVGASETEFGRLGIKVAEIGAGIGTVISFVTQNISWIAPSVMGVVGAMIIWKNVIGAINTVAAVLNSITTISATITAIKSKAVAADAAATTGATAAQWGLNTALLTCPVTWIVLGILALIAVFVILYNKCEWVRDIVNSVGDAISWVGDKIGGFLGWAGEKLGIASEEAGKAGGENLKNGFTQGTQNLTGDTQSSINDALSGLQLDSSLLQGFGLDATSNIASGITSGTDAVVNAAKGMTTQIEGVAKPEVDMKINSDALAVKEFGNSVKDVTKDVQSSMGVMVKDVNTQTNSIGKDTQDCASEIKKSFSNIKLFGTGVNIMTGLINGMLSKKTALKTAANNMAQSIPNTMNTTLDINSPSGVTENTGINSGDGLTKGLRKSTLGVAEAARDMGGIVGAIAPMQPPPISAPLNSSQVIRESRSRSIENNSYAPVFNLTVNGGDGDRENERKVKKWVSEAMENIFDSMARKNPNLQEV